MDQAMSVGNSHSAEYREQEISFADVTSHLQLDASL